MARLPSFAGDLIPSENYSISDQCKSQIVHVFSVSSSSLFHIRELQYETGLDFAMETDIRSPKHHIEMTTNCI